MNSDKCHYCKKEEVTHKRFFTVYKAIQRISQERVKYIKYDFPINTCEKCLKNIQKSDKSIKMITMLSLLLAIIAYFVQLVIFAPTEDDILSQVFIFIFGVSFVFMVLRSVIGILYTIIRGITGNLKDLETFSHPFLKTLKKYGWQIKEPHPKYDTMPKDVIREQVDEKVIEEKQQKDLKEADMLYQLFINNHFN